MTALNPAYFFNGRTDHSAQMFRLLLDAIADKRGGVEQFGSLAVTVSSGLTVSIAAGGAFIRGTSVASPQPQGAYYVHNDAALLITLDAAHATLPRIDTIVAKIEDTQYGGATNAWSLAKVTGTPASSPVAPALPANSIPLADCRVNAAQTSIASVTDRRDVARSMGGGYYPIAEQILVADSGTINLNNLPQTHRHLHVMVKGWTTHTDVTPLRCRVNGDSGAVYDVQYFDVNHLTLAYARSTGTSSLDLGALNGTSVPTPTDNGSQVIIEIPDYSRATWRKAATARSGFNANAGPRLDMKFSEYRSAAAITRLEFFPQNGSFKAGTIITVYGMGRA